MRYKLTYWKDWEQKEAFFNNPIEARKFAMAQDPGWTIESEDGVYFEQDNPDEL